MDTGKLNFVGLNMTHESPQKVFMRNEGFQVSRMATALFAWGNIGLLIRIWTLKLSLLITVLCDGWDKYLVFVLKVPLLPILFNYSAYLSDSLSNSLNVIWKMNTFSSWFYTHCVGINYNHPAMISICIHPLRLSIHVFKEAALKLTCVSHS